MRATFLKNERGETELEVSCSSTFWRKEVISVLKSVDGIQLESARTAFWSREFCVFYLDGYKFRVSEDDGLGYGICTILSPEASGTTWCKIYMQFESHIASIPKPSLARKTSKPLVVVLSAMLGVAILFWLTT